jgi:hypothetical protein
MTASAGPYMLHSLASEFSRRIIITIIIIIIIRISFVFGWINFILFVYS